ncbi:Olfactory receptor 3A2 [Gossypium arboreum]|uniref:Olfactory receptor 3A2 n=1 Tax=Gossypium arboreum TaxID=29729 RepID=A0A0B0PRP9_GOSAR|nr:Olfactory receptor 3A2 [Gossypium arboreum]
MYIELMRTSWDEMNLWFIHLAQVGDCQRFYYTIKLSFGVQKFFSASVHVISPNILSFEGCLKQLLSHTVSMSSISYCDPPLISLIPK